METDRLETILQHLRKLIGVPGPGPVSDGQLLECFARHRDEAAFELLVRRHGALVWNVCRRLVGNDADAEDAFQATFLVLVRRAGGLDKRGSLAGWLYGVAYRVGVRARANLARRRVHERAAALPAGAVVSTDPAARLLREQLDEEVNRLPEKYRVPVVLCYLEGLTHEEAARQLRWPLGTLKCRLTRARERLQRRLAGRGLALASGLLAAPAWEALTAGPAVPPTLMSETMANIFHAAGGVSTQAAALAEGVIRSMTATRLTIAAVTVLLLGTVAGAATWTYRAWPGHNQDDGVVQAEPNRGFPPPDRKAGPEPEPMSLERFHGPWNDLAGEESKALRAVLVFAAAPRETVRYFKEHLKPVVVEEKQMARWIADLDSDQFAVREKAVLELAYLREHAVPALRRALAGKPSAELRRQAEQLVEQAQSSALPPGWVRALRAVAVLEHLGTPEARAVLESLARAEAKSAPRQEAEDALKRLSNPPRVTLEERWEALGGKDDARAVRALLALAAPPAEAVPFLKEQLAKKKPPDDDEQRIARLIGDLNNDDYQTRQKATKDLTDLGSLAEPALRRALAGQADQETRLRIQAILQAFQNPAIRNAVPKPSLSKLTRRLKVLLEHIDTMEAREVLKGLEQKKKP
jgi:RNA polymerase sigma factor (sigma-70 family)